MPPIMANTPPKNNKTAPIPKITTCAEPINKQAIPGINVAVLYFPKREAGTTTPFFTDCIRKESTKKSLKTTRRTTTVNTIAMTFENSPI